jgi:hypothetical protein
MFVKAVRKYRDIVVGHLKVGDVVEMTDDRAEHLVDIGYVEIVKAPKAEKSAAKKGNKKA